jgi:hypothetical protein
LATAARRSADGPVGQEGLVLLVEQHRHRHPAVRQRTGHPPLLQGHVRPAGILVPGGELVRVDLARRDQLLQMADEPGVHLLLQRAAGGGLRPDVQPDDPGRLGPGRLKPAVHVAKGGVMLADLLQDCLGRVPEGRRQRVPGCQQPAPDGRQRRKGVGRRHAEQCDRDVAPAQLGHPAVGEFGDAVSLEFHASQRTTLASQGARPSSLSRPT